MHFEHQFFQIWIKYVLLVEVDFGRIVWSDIL